jgi:F420-dependent oxidoreductase-like protein
MQGMAAMKLGLHVANFTFPDGAPALGSDLARVARAADELGFDRVSVMDHVWQIGHLGPPEHEMLEAYTTLGYLAGQTTRIKLLTLVTGVTYRSPGLLIKAVTTLDVLSSGRAMLGIGAAWNDEESQGLGLFLPPLSERYERLEETLQIALQMWSGSDERFAGKHYTLGRTLNSPQSIQRPHPPILIGGAGEKKTLRLVAKYAQACNLFNAPDLVHKLDVLRQHCATEGTEYDAIEKTVNYRFDVGPGGENAVRIVDELSALAQLGVTVAHGSVRDVSTIKPLEILAEQVMPHIGKL